MQPQKYWREIPRRYRLEAGKCAKCGKIFMPPRLVCDACGSRQFAKTTLQDTGVIHTFAVVRTPPAGFTGQAPYVLAVVELDGGPKLTMQIADCAPEDAHIGDRIRVAFRKITESGNAGVICYGYKGVLA